MIRASVLAGIIALPVVAISPAAAQSVPLESVSRVLNRIQGQDAPALGKARTERAGGAAAWARSTSKPQRYAPRVRGRAARSNDNG